ncbi:16S rRNA methyltransferase [Pseudoalteromonas piscicida]|uniref:Ribosomal RNA small subunit methyltransferase C n=1 Tax=Pseudoalteromonas piscicida TaxID=43662 RepID=A0AAQ2EQG4_PSEO7|nr:MULTISPECIES: methyltransferase [Pseudoalteromonas]KJY87639.1 16S rRNA methyltransferase [Pseudoalteromonas piscicida]TMN36372.1 16S rRNA methyltransferase [Pseudoalteromonas piscicida]TMN45482.1 16S rRNA methyltransferase [Pseudoalteromonas piscicida]TMN46948.1 16S rRNA methyltransferase [Pseudoalteromonas piscicida]TMN47032.1 16S rRNA methyltransferase [Pseudoalteromonas piscicida]
MQFTNPSLLLLRNEEELIANNILVINHQRDGFLRELKALNPSSAIHAFSFDFADHLHADKIADVKSYVDHQLPQLQDIDLVIYYYPKSKPEAQMVFDNIRHLSTAETRLLVVGENKSGVKSAEKQLKEHAAHCYKLESAKHCILYEFDQLTANPSFDVSHYVQTFSVRIAKTEFTAASLPGVFNHGKLDAGTQLLLENVTLPYKGKVLDFGCGAGLIACYALLNSPTLKFTCLDVNALALFATQQTLALNNLSATLLLSDGLSELNGKFNLILSNPPFHTGLSTDYDIAEQFLHNIKRHMDTKSNIQLVANSFLKYPPILEAQFEQFEVVTKNTKFAIYKAQ